jgi:hypothetical protein
MTDRTAAALASALPAGVELRPSYPGSDVWYARDIAAFQAERLAESGYRLIYVDEPPQTFAAHTAEALALIHDHVEGGDED